MSMARPPEVHSITGAGESLSQEQTGRTKRYLVSMTIRTACVLLAIVVPGWPRWVFLAGAVALPYLAVVAANSGRSRRGAPPPPVTVMAPMLPPGPASAGPQASDQAR
jgi:hypothetical protein